MERNIKVFRAHRALYWLYGALLVALGAVVYLAPDAGTLRDIVPALVFLAVIFTAHLLAARGARARAPWGRVLSLILGIVLLFGFPIGTLIGAYIIYNAWHRWDPPTVPTASA